MAALADFGGKMDRGLGRRATADVLWDQVSLLPLVAVASLDLTRLSGAATHLPPQDT